LPEIRGFRTFTRALQLTLYCSNYFAKLDINMSKEPTKKKNPAAVALSKLGASKGGIARAKKLSQAERSRIARKAVLTRWKKNRSKKTN